MAFLVGRLIASEVVGSVGDFIQHVTNTPSARRFALTLAGELKNPTFCDLDDRPILVLEDTVRASFLGEQVGELLRPTQTTSAGEPDAGSVDEVSFRLPQPILLVEQALGSLYDRGRVRQLSAIGEPTAGRDDDCGICTHFTLLAWLNRLI